MSIRTLEVIYKIHFAAAIFNAGLAGQSCSLPLLNCVHSLCSTCSFPVLMLILCPGFFFTLQSCLRVSNFMRSSARLYTKCKESALAERFHQILEDKISNSTKSMIDRDPTLKELYKKYEGDAIDPTTHDKQFARLYQKELAYAKSEHLLRSRNERELADPTKNPAWTGQERLQDTALRMLLDSVPPPKPVKPQRTIISRPVAVSDRVRNAKESSLDYKVGRTLTAEEKEKDNFKELYKERLLGPSMFVDSTSPKATLGLIGSMADARINAAIDAKTGRFESADMEGVRGKPLDRQRLANSTDTNFFVNEIIKNQDCIPPWIENQQGIDRDVQAFRFELQKKWFKLIIGKLSVHDCSQQEMLAKLSIDGNRAFSTYKDEFAVHSEYAKAKIAELNRGIRSYNLQCPSSNLHKWKLLESTEVLRLFDAVMSDIQPLIQEWYSRQLSVRRIQPKETGSGRSVLGLFESGPSTFGSATQYAAFERPAEKMQFWQLVKRIFL